MSVLVVSVSHRTAPLSTLSALATDSDGAVKLLDAVTASPWIDEAVVLSTCNRTEIYVACQRFHGALEAVVGELAASGGLPEGTIADACSVFYDDAAVGHCFTVASGLDSVVAGEHQILGQVRKALTVAQGHGTVGSMLNALFQQALRVAKRVQTETEIGNAGRSLVGAALDGLDLADLTGRRVTIVGAGSMAAVAAHAAADRGASVTVVNRTFERAARLAERTGGTARPFTELADTLGETEVLCTCTGAQGLRLSAAELAGTPVREVIDLGLPADVDDDVLDLPGVRLMNLDRLVADHSDEATSAEVAAATTLVAHEVADFVAGRRAAAVTPTVVALRSMANDVLAREERRLRQRLPELDENQAEEIHHAMRRVVEKLLHQPTVQLKKSAGTPDSPDYASALRDLFALDQTVIEAVSQP